MPADAGDDSVVFNEIDNFADQVGPFISNPEVPDIADYKGPDCSGIDCLFGIACKVIRFWPALSDPLDLSAPFLTIFFEKFRRVGACNNRIDSVFFTYLERLDNLLIREVMIE